MGTYYQFTTLNDAFAFLLEARGLPEIKSVWVRRQRCVRACIPLCANMSETSRPSTITVGRGKKSHFDKHKQDKHFFRCTRPPLAGSRFRGDRPATQASLHRRV